jgi:hypothetical protein
MTTRAYRQYQTWQLWAMLAAYVIGAATSGFVVGAVLVLALQLGVLVWDWSGFSTLEGWIFWRTLGAGARVLLVLGFFCLSPIFLGIYLARVAYFLHSGKAAPLEPVTPPVRPTGAVPDREDPPLSG